MCRSCTTAARQQTALLQMRVSHTTRSPLTGHTPLSFMCACTAETLHTRPAASPLPPAIQPCCALSAEKAPATGEAAGEDAGADDGDDGEWEVAAKSHNAARRKKRKEARRANWAAAAAQRAAQAEDSKEEGHHLEGTADGGDSEDWETDGMGQPSRCILAQAVICTCAWTGRRHFVLLEHCLLLGVSHA